MANSPPPYDDITGISRTVMKDNAQESIVNYNGNARPGEIVVDLTTNPPTPYIGNNIGQLTLLTSAGTYGNIQVSEYLEAAQVGNIIPSGNAVYTLGNATNQWSDLYVSNATIYLNNVPVGLTSANVLTVNGNEVLSSNSNSNISTTGNIFADNGTFTTAVTARNLNADSGNISLNPDFGLIFTQSNAVVTANTASWTFDESGNLNLPDYGYVNFNGGKIVQSSSNTLGIVVQDPNNDLNSLDLVVDDGAEAVQTRVLLDREQIRFDIDLQGSNYIWTFDNNGFMYGPGRFRETATDNGLTLDGGSDDVYLFTAGEGPVRIVANSDGETSREWTFSQDGSLAAPGDIVVAGDITGTVGANTLILKAQPTTDTYIQLNSIVDSTVSIAANLDIVTDSSNTEQTWTFDNTGTFTAPGTITTGGNVDAANFNGGNLFNMTLGSRVLTNGLPIQGGAYDYSSLYVGFDGGDNGIALNSFGNAPVQINTGDGGANTYNWTFSNSTGEFSAPGNIITAGNITGNTAGYAIGYRDIPQVSFTGNATIATTDAGKHFYSTQSTDYILTIANNASQGFQVGAAITIVNQGSGTITVAQGSGVTLYLAGNVTAGNRTVATFGMATIMKVATDTWFINGTGVS